MEQTTELDDDREIINVISRGDDMWYNSQYLRRKSSPNENIGKRMVITAGFIPLKTRIENMVAAGLDLQAQREELYPDVYEYEASLLDEEPYDDLDEITIMQRGLRAEEALKRRRLKPQEDINAVDERKTKPSKVRKPSKGEVLSEPSEEEIE